jgi:flagellin FlaB
MKNQKETKQDELAAIGIGAMIVFIALILVAAVAAAVIIQTAEKLQQNAQASGDDTQEQMSTKVTLINIIIEATTAAPVANHDLFVTFELAPGSEPTQGDDVGYTVICENGAGTDTVFAQGDLTGATVHTGDGAGAAAITLNPGTTYVFVMEIDECAPTANTDNILILTVDGGGATYEELQYGSSPSVGDVVV